jgi:hypothetical protein
LCGSDDADGCGEDDGDNDNNGDRVSAMLVEHLLHSKPVLRSCDRSVTGVICLQVSYFFFSYSLFSCWALSHSFSLSISSPLFLVSGLKSLD